MSRMFLNQVSSRELFTNGRDKRNSQCSENSQQMYHNSQIEMSENSQDMNHSQSILNELNGSESQGRRMFDRFMTKRTHSENSFKSTPAKQTFNQGPSSYNPAMSLPVKQPFRQNYQQQIVVNKSKAKDRDERDVLDVVVNTVKECSDEVKSNIKIFQQNLEQMSDSSNEKFSAMANSIFDVLTEKLEKVGKSFSSREEKRHSVHEMEKELTRRDAKIEELKNEIARQQSDREKQLIDNLKNIIEFHHQETNEKLEKLWETGCRQTDSHQQILDNQRQQRDNMDMHFKQFQNSHGKRHEEIKQGIISELQQLRLDLDDHKKHLEDYFANHLTTAQYKHAKEIQYHLSTGLDNQTQQTRENSREICNYQISQFSDICKAQQKAQEQFLKSQMQEQAKMRMHEHEKLSKQVEMISLKQLHVQDYYKTPSKCEEIISKNVQQQLDEMHRKYTEELNKLREDIDAAGISKQDSQSVYQHTFSNRQDVQSLTSRRNSYTLQKNERSQDTISHFSNSEFSNHNRFLVGKSQESQNYDKNTTKSFAFVSPGFRADTLNAKPKSAFLKTNPSPIAAVLPQQHNKENVDIHETKTVERKKRGRKKRTYGQPSRKSQRLNRKETDTEYETSDASQNPEIVSSNASGWKHNSPKLISNVIPRTEAKNISYGIGQNKRDSDLHFKVPVSSQNLQNERRCIPTNSQNSQTDRKSMPSSQNSYTERKTNSASCSYSGSHFSEKRPSFLNTFASREKQENIFPVKPTTYSVSNLRQSFSTEGSSDQPKRKLTTPNYANNDIKWKTENNIPKKPASIYDFNESPESSKKSIKQIEKYGKQSSTRESSELESSRESSPSLSITKIMIQRKVKNHKRTSDGQGHSREIGPRRESLPESSEEFLSASNRQDDSHASEKWESQSVMSNYRRSGEKRKLFNFDLGQELMAIKKAFVM